MNLLLDYYPNAESVVWLCYNTFGGKQKNAP